MTDKQREAFEIAFETLNQRNGLFLDFATKYWMREVWSLACEWQAAQQPAQAEPDDIEAGKAIYMMSLQDRKGFREDQLGIDSSDPIWDEIFKDIGQCARTLYQAKLGEHCLERVYPPSKAQPPKAVPDAYAVIDHEGDIEYTVTVHGSSDQDHDWARQCCHDHISELAGEGHEHAGKWVVRPLTIGDKSQPPKTVPDAVKDAGFRMCRELIETTGSCGADAVREWAQSLIDSETDNPGPSTTARDDQ